MHDRLLPFNSLPPLLPSIGLETHPILKQAILAHRILAELRQIGLTLPNQSILIHTLGLQEAKLSSEIENIVTTNDELYRAYLNKEIESDPQVKEVLRYPTALWHGFDAIKEKKRMLTTKLFEEICQILKGHEAGIRKIGGTKLKNSLGEVIYTPPEGEDVIRQKLKQLEEFIYLEKNLDPLVKLALIHYQFEAIHPFHDGNGRTGRILNLLYLIDVGLLDIPILYLSRYFLLKRGEYYNGLRRITEENRWEEWILYFLQGVAETAEATLIKIREIQKLMKMTSHKIKEELPRIYTKDLVEVLFQFPYCKIKFLEDRGVAHRDTASTYLKKLEEIGVMRSMRIGREKYYINDSFVKLLSQ